jgi:phosphoacetylglucosamine mutase
VKLVTNASNASNLNDKLVVDGANGVGGDKVEVLKYLCGGLIIEVRNTSNCEGFPNEEVRVDFVRKEKVVPSGLWANKHAKQKHQGK